MISLYAAGAPLRTPEPDDEVDPMSSVANIADAMLVFACGLMVALVVAWNVDLLGMQEVEIEGSEQVEDIQALEDILSAEGSAYIERGTVYQDPRTGQMYLLEDTGRDGSPAQGGNAGQSGQGSASGASGGSADASGAGEGA